MNIRDTEASFFIIPGLTGFIEHLGIDKSSLKSSFVGRFIQYGIDNKYPYTFANLGRGQAYTFAPYMVSYMSCIKTWRSGNRLNRCRFFLNTACPYA
jgi:hypothetical protein